MTDEQLHLLIELFTFKLPMCLQIFMVILLLSLIFLSLLSFIFSSFNKNKEI